MKIGIDASRAFLNNRTGIEEYSYQIIKYLAENLKASEVILYAREKGEGKLDFKNKKIKIREIRFHRFWTQVGLSFELLLNPVDILFVPAHTVPWIHPRRTVVTVHGLEYEHCPESYSFWSRFLHRFFIKKSCYWAKEIIAVSQKTKKDLIDLYKITTEKIRVVYNGYDNLNYKLQTTNYKSIQNLKLNSNYLLYIGRLERRKNIEGIIKAFEILKEKYNYGGKLILAGRPGYGYNNSKFEIRNSKFKKDIIEKGFVDNKEKWDLMRGADVFLFPSFSEGFGIPILEAQSAGVPAITSNYGPMDEVAGDKEILIDPKNSLAIAILTDKLINDRMFRQKIIERGLENTRKFSWEKSGKEVESILKNL